MCVSCCQTDPGRCCRHDVLVRLLGDECDGCRRMVMVMHNGRRRCGGKETRRRAACDVVHMMLMVLRHFSVGDLMPWLLEAIVRIGGRAERHIVRQAVRMMMGVENTTLGFWAGGWRGCVELLGVLLQLLG